MKNRENNLRSVIIECDVKNCKFHTEGGACTASKIKVGPAYAVSSYDTLCSSFASDEG